MQPLTHNYADIELINQLEKAVTPSEITRSIELLIETKTIAAIPNLINLLSHHHPLVPPATLEALVKLAPDSVEPLITAYAQIPDQGVQAYIIQGLSRIGDERGVDVLIDVVGIAIANHCQGNVRRVAARGLGQIGISAHHEQILAKVLDKLHWALIAPEDWALRYAAAVSLEEIGMAKKSNSSLSAKIIAMLEDNLLKETDEIVQLREKKALSKLA